MPEKKYLPGSMVGVYEILQRDDTNTRNPRYLVKCSICKKEKWITRNTVCKYAQLNQCMCDKSLSCSVGDVFGIYTVIDTEYRDKHKFVSFRCNVCGHVRTRQKFSFIRDFSNNIECKCKKSLWKDVISHKSSAEIKADADRKYNSFVGKKVGTWEILWMCNEKNVCQKRVVRFYWCKCTACGKLKKIRTDFVVNSSGKCVECKHRYDNYIVNSSGKSRFPDEYPFRQDVFGANDCGILGEYSSVFGSQVFMETVAQASIDGTLCELGQYFCLDGISTKENMIPSKKARQLAFHREHPNWQTVWYNENGTRRIRHFRAWKHGKRGKKVIYRDSTM